MARRLELGEREKQIAQHMRHAADRGVELVRRLMTFARKQTLSPVPIDPAELTCSEERQAERMLPNGMGYRFNGRDYRSGFVLPNFFFTLTSGNTNTRGEEGGQHAVCGGAVQVLSAPHPAFGHLLPASGAKELQRRSPRLRGEGAEGG